MSKVDTKVPGEAVKDGEGDFIQVRKKSDKMTSAGNSDKHSGTDKRKNKSRSRNNSLGEGKASKARSRPSSANTGRTVKVEKGRPVQRHKNMRKGGKTGRNYEDEEWRTVYIGFVERGTSSEDLAKIFKDSGEIERLTLKEGFAFILFKEESSVSLACKLDGTCLNGLNLRVAPRKEKPPEVKGVTLLDLDMKKFRHEKHPFLFTTVDDYHTAFNCVGSFSQDKKEPNTIIVPGCPPVLDWDKMDLEEGEICLTRQAENAPELNTQDSIFKSVSICTPELEIDKVNIVTNRQCLMKMLAPVDPSIVQTSNRCFKMNCTKSARGPLFLDLEYKWHPSMGTAKSFQDAITLPAPEMVKNIAYPGIFYRINELDLGDLNILVRTQVHAEDPEQILDIQPADSDDEEEENGEDFFEIEEKEDEKEVTENGTSQSLKLSASAAEWVPKTKTWNTFENSDMKWIKNDQLFNLPESRYEIKTVDIAGSFWDYSAEKTFYQMLLGGVDYLLLGVLLNNEHVINKEEYDLLEVHAKVMETKNPTDACLVLSKLERILSKLVEFGKDLKEDEKLELVYDGRKEHLTFYKVKTT